MMGHKFQFEICYLTAGFARTNSMLMQPLPLKVKRIENFKTSVEYFFFGRRRTFLYHQNRITFNARNFVLLTNRGDYRIHKNADSLRTVAELSGRHELRKSADIRNKYSRIRSRHILIN